MGQHRVIVAASVLHTLRGLMQADDPTLLVAGGRRHRSGHIRPTALGLLNHGLMDHALDDGEQAVVVFLGEIPLIDELGGIELPNNFLVPILVLLQVFQKRPKGHELGNGEGVEFVGEPLKSLLLLGCQTRIGVTDSRAEFRHIPFRELGTAESLLNTGIAKKISALHS